LGMRKIGLSILLLLSLKGFAKPVHYSFLSHWEIKAPLKEVWDYIDRGKDWHAWWRSVVKTKVLQESVDNGPGQIIEYTWKSFLPFKLKINFKITGRELYREIRGESTGDLAGTGVWRFEERNGITYVDYQWEVESTKKLVNFLSHFMKGFFTYNHNVIMRRGEKGLKKAMER
jgi:hypothetical protein